MQISSLPAAPPLSSAYGALEQIFIEVSYLHISISFYPFSVKSRQRRLSYPSSSRNFTFWSPKDGGLPL